MKIVEVILSVFVIIGIAFKFLHYPGSGVILIMSLGVLSMMYFTIGFILFSNFSFKDLGKTETFKKQSTMRVVGAVLTGVALSIASIGILFKFQSYPGAGPQMIIGAFSLGVILILSLIKWLVTKDSFYANILKRVVVYFSVVSFLLALPTASWLEWKYPNNPDYVKALLKAKANPEDESLWDQVEKERSKMYETEITEQDQKE